MGPLILRAEIEKWHLKAPFKITGYTFEALNLLVVDLEMDGLIGRGEAAGVYYRGENAASMLKQLEQLRPSIEKGIDRESLRRLLPPGGARSALDCALWDLEARLTGRPAWEIAKLDMPKPLLTTFTCGADTPEVMVETARTYKDARAIKLKLTGQPIDRDRIRAVREGLPEVWLGVDANQGFSQQFLEELMPVLVEMKVALIEQPFPIGQDSLLDNFQSPIPIAADESLQSLGDIKAMAGRFNVVNIKLDKCGGLTEGLMMARAAREIGLDIMVGNMTGTSLGMAPAFLVGQLCDVVDLDGPVFLRRDRSIPVRYSDGRISCPDELWGNTERHRAR